MYIEDGNFTSTSFLMKEREREFTQFDNFPLQSMNYPPLYANSLRQLNSFSLWLFVQITFASRNLEIKLLCITIIYECV